MGVFHHDDGRINHGADRDRDASERHDVGGQVQRMHQDKGYDDGDRQGDDDYKRAGNVKQKDNDDDADDQAFFDELLLQRGDRPEDQVRAVVGRYELDAGWERRLELLDFLLDALDQIERILSMAHHNDGAHDLALAVQFCYAPAHIGAQSH